MLAPDSFEEIVEQTIPIDSGGDPVTLEIFHPAADRSYPAVVLVHGSGGLKWSGEGYRFAARYLAVKDYLVIIPHYFETTSTTWADRSGIAAHSQRWLQALEQTVAFARRMQEVDRDRIALVGFSLGAYLSLALGTRTAGIACIVDFFGGLPSEVADAAGPMPPVLILHGDADKSVPVSEAYRLEEVLQANGVPYEITIYPNVGHGFHASLSGAALDAMQKTERFLARYLGA